VKGTITDIQRFSIHDGPGIRTTVFLKGCNMRCFWCHNPETLGAAPELQFFPSKCIGCGACLETCPREAHQVVDSEHVLLRERCVACGQCAETCYAEALVMAGREATASEVMEQVLRDKPFYDNSGGGMTLSGGEPLFQIEFSLELLRIAKAEGLHTAVETNAAWPWERVAQILPSTDLVMMDIKALDAAKHREATGIANALILENARRLSREARSLLVRTPVIPGFNDTEEDIGAIAELAAGFPNLVAYELLPYHPLGEGKYKSLGMPYRAAGLKTPDKAEVEYLRKSAARCGIPVR